MAARKLLLTFAAIVVLAADLRQSSGQQAKSFALPSSGREAPPESSWQEELQRQLLQGQIGAAAEPIDPEPGALEQSKKSFIGGLFFLGGAIGGLLGALFMRPSTCRSYVRPNCNIQSPTQ